MPRPSLPPTVVSLFVLPVHTSHPCGERGVGAQTSRDQMLNEVRTLCALPELEGLVKFYGAFYTQEEGRISIALEYMNGEEARRAPDCPTTQRPSTPASTPAYHLRAPCTPRRR